MNNQMIVKFTQVDESSPDFPFGERKIDASSWIKQGYKKIDNYIIYNPNPKPLEKNFDLANAISSAVEMSKSNFPELFLFFEKNDSFDEFLRKDIKIKYVDSSFNEYSNKPEDDYFLVIFDDYQINISRKKFKDNSISLNAYDLKRINKAN